MKQGIREGYCIFVNREVDPKPNQYQTSEIIGLGSHVLISHDLLNLVLLASKVATLLTSPSVNDQSLPIFITARNNMKKAYHYHCTFKSVIVIVWKVCIDVLNICISFSDISSWRKGGRRVSTWCEARDDSTCVTVTWAEWNNRKVVTRIEFNNELLIIYTVSLFDLN